MSDLGLTISFERLKPYRKNRNCEKCLHGNATTQHLRLGDKALLDRIREIDPVGYMELSSNKLKSIIARSCPNCAYQWLEISRDESDKYYAQNDIKLMEAREDIIQLATIITYKLEAKIQQPLTTLADELKNIMDTSTDVFLCIPRGDHPDLLAEKVAELAASGFHFTNLYRRLKDA